MRYLHAGTILALGLAVIATSIRLAMSGRFTVAMLTILGGWLVVIAVDFAFFVVRLRGGR